MRFARVRKVVPEDGDVLFIIDVPTGVYRIQWDLGENLIMIGTNEAIAIDRRLNGIETPRPMTHDLLASVITKLGARINFSSP